MAESKLISVETAWARIDRALRRRRLPIETVRADEAAGRTLAVGVRAALDLPPFDKAAMDGYAVREGDERTTYRLIETVPAGRVPAQRLAPGAAIKVMTGAPVPARTGRVIPVECVEESGGLVRVVRPSAPRHICRRGEDGRRGDRVLRAPAALDAAGAACLVAAGVEEVQVFRRLRVAILATGAEIVCSPRLLAPGRIMDANTPLLAGLCRRHGFAPVARARVGDDSRATVRALRRILPAADLALVTGGISAGDFDYVPDALRALGLEVHFAGLAIKPGKPCVFATAPGTLVFGLPGNPVSAYLVFHLLVLRAAAALEGRPYAPRRLTLRLAEGFARRGPGREEYVPCRVGADGTASPVVYHGSAHLAALLESDGFVVVPPDATRIRAGSPVSAIVLRGFGP